MLSLLLFIVVLAFACSAFRWRHLSRYLAGIALLLVFAAGCGVVPQVLLSDLQREFSGINPTAFGARNAIVLLGGGTESLPEQHGAEVATLAYARLLKTAEVYQACKQSGAVCKVIVSGGDPQQHGVTEAAVYADRLRRLAVAADDLVSEARSMNTWQNAQFTRPLLIELAADRVFFVTSAIHLRRSRIYFEHFGIDAIPLRADYIDAPASVLPQAYNLALTDLAMHEYLGIWRFHIYNAFGWNAPRAARLQPAKG